MKPWECQDDESSSAFEAFVLYRDTHPRSLRKVSETLDKSKSLIESWSREHSWVTRAQKWDAELERLKEDWFRISLSYSVRILLIDCRAFSSDMLKPLTKANTNMAKSGIAG